MLGHARPWCRQPGCPAGPRGRICAALPRPPPHPLLGHGQAVPLPPSHSRCRRLRRTVILWPRYPFIFSSPAARGGKARQALQPRAARLLSSLQVGNRASSVRPCRGAQPAGGEQGIPQVLLPRASLPAERRDEGFPRPRAPVQSSHSGASEGCLTLSRSPHAWHGSRPSPRSCLSADRTSPTAGASLAASLQPPAALAHGARDASSKPLSIFHGAAVLDQAASARDASLRL